MSPVLARRVSGARSAGRVQSVALRLVCEREEAIRGFVPEAYWVLGVKASKAGKPDTAFKAKLARINGQKAEVKDEATAAGHAAELRKRGLRTLGVSRAEKRRGAPPPFITSSLQQAASGACGFSPSRTMSLAQRLYEGMDVGEGTAGLITYMRTDSFTVSAQAQAQAAQLQAQVVDMVQANMDSLAAGGELIDFGAPEEIVAHKKCHTAEYLAPLLK